MLKPYAYTEREGSHWIDWVGPGVADEALQHRTRANRGVVWIGGRNVHSLAFGVPVWRDFPRWDCINGWTMPIKPGRPRKHG